MMWEKIKSVVGQYLEINETRKSVVVMALILITIMGLYKAYLGNDVPPNITSIIIGLSSVVFGINASNALSGMYSSYVSNKNQIVDENIDINFSQTENVSLDDSHVNGSI